MSGAKPTRQQIARRANAAEYRRRIIEAGGRQINILLDRSAVEHLEAIQRATGETQQALVSRLLAREVERTL